jgi:FtsP/CotA-like multicopper oxidase with cupredoxin domain
VTLHFVELYYTAPCSGKRIFSIDVLDTTTSPDVKDLDICAAAGGPNRALTRTVSGVAVSDGYLNIRSVYGSIDDPEVAAIEVVPASVTPPTVTATTPANGATGVATNVKPTATFSRGMDGTTITNSSFTLSAPGPTPVAASVAYSVSSLTATLTPNTVLAASTTYTAKLNTTIKDTNGTALASVFTWSFTTASAPPPPPPTSATSIDLCAKAGSVTMPGAVGLPIWGFALKPANVSCTDASVIARLPGPVLDVGVGDVVTLNVTNALTGRTISIEAPGIGFDPGPTDAAPGTTVSLKFTASAPGTYLYESAGDAGRQEAMGLYGALVVRPACPTPPCQAYGNAASAYDLERTLVLSEIDPALNADPDNFDMQDWAATYWLINGKAYPNTSTIDVQPGKRLLLRYLNAGIDNNTMALLGMHQRLVARDAYPLNNPFYVVAETFPSGQTADAIATIPTASSGTTFPLYNRQLHLTNGNLGGPAYAPGGMLTFIRVT